MTGEREMDLVAGILGPAGVPPDGVLIVHSAFRGLSRAGVRAESFIEAIAAAMASGTLLMPAMTWRTVTPENPYFDELATPSHTGALGELFRTEYATARSIHPTHSTAARGPLANELVAGHHIDVTPCSPNSPFGKLVEADGWILLVGVGFECCTAIHCGEEAVAPDLYLRPQVELYECRDRFGRVHTVRARRHRRLDRDFPQFGRRLAAQGRLRTGDAAGTGWQLCRARDLMATVMAALAERPDGTIKPASARRRYAGE